MWNLCCFSYDTLDCQRLYLTLVIMGSLGTAGKDFILCR